MKEKRKTYIIFSLFTIALMLCAGCGKKEEVPEAEETPQYFIEQSDADTLLEEALDGTECAAVFEDTLELDGRVYYTYKVSDPSGEDLGELAVDGQSGDVTVYEPENGMKSFEEFKYYENSRRKITDISWDGTFVLDKLTVELTAGDESSFEFIITKKGEELLSGFVRVEGDRADWVSEDEKEQISFKMIDGQTLQLVEKGMLRISGQYIREVR